MSAFAFGGVPARVLRSALSTSEVCVSEHLLGEYRSVPDALRAGRKVNAEQWQAMLAGIAALVAEARLVEPTRPIRVCRDPKDDAVGCIAREQAFSARPRRTDPRRRLEPMPDPG